MKRMLGKGAESWSGAETRQALVSIMCLLLLLPSCSRPPPGNERQRQPYDVVLIVIDALRADHVGCYGYGRNTTPAIDSVCEQGIVFENAIAQGTWTLTSIPSLFTSTYRNVCVGREGRQTPSDNLYATTTTLHEVLSSTGYRTAAFSANPIIMDADGMELFDEAEVVGDDRALTQRATAWIGRNKREPFFLYLHYFAPHAPYDPPDAYTRRFKEDYSGPIGFQGRHTDFFMNASLDEEDLAELRARYDGEVASADSEVGEVLATLRREGLLDDTLLIIAADHGEALGERGEFGHGIITESVIHVPLVILSPGSKSPARHGGVVELIDIPPTVLSALGMESPASFQGTDLLSIVADTAEKDYAFSEMVSVEKCERYVGVRSKSNLLVWNGSEGSYALYGLGPQSSKGLSSLERSQDIWKGQDMVPIRRRVWMGRHWRD